MTGMTEPSLPLTPAREFADEVKIAETTSLLVLQGTTFCNLNCSYCYLPHRSRRDQMSPETVAASLQNLDESQLLGERLTVLWHAGEPLTLPKAYYRNALKLIARFSDERRAIRSSIQTNGTLIDAGFCDLFKEFKVRVGVSLDGPKALNDSCRQTRSGRGTYDATMRGIRRLQQAKLDYYVITVLTSSSLDAPEQLYNFYREHGIRNVAFNIEEIEGVNTGSSLSQGRDDRRVGRFLERMYALTTRDSEIHVREFDQFEQILTNGELALSSSMNSPFQLVSVGANGDFSTFSPELLGMKSEIYGDFIFGNVHNDRIVDIKEGKKFKKVFDDIKTGVTACSRKCQYFAVCGGGAPSNKLFENGSFASGETMFCKFTKQAVAEAVLKYHESSPANSETE